VDGITGDEPERHLLIMDPLHDAADMLSALSKVNDENDRHDLATQRWCALPDVLHVLITLTQISIT
jgi:hypothetical protein